MESELSVRDVLTKEYVGVSESDTVLGAVRLMREERAGCVLVLRGSEPVGIMTEWDVLGVVADESNPAETTVETVMSTPVLSVAPDRSLADAANTMTRENIRNLLVRTGDEVLGIVTQRDVIAAAGSFQGATTTSEPSGSSVVRETGESSTTVAPNGGDEFATQGVCESCGTLADALWESNGRLVCSDCRSV